MSRPAVPLPLSLPRPVFTTAEALGVGVSNDRLRAADVRRLGYGLHALTDIDLTEAAILRACTRSSSQITASGPSAARYWGMPLPRKHQTWSATPDPATVHLTAPGSARRNTSLLRWSRQRLDPDEIVVEGGLRVTTRVRTWLDLSRLLSRDQLVQVGDHLVRQPRPWAENRTEPYATPAELLDAAATYTGRHRRRLLTALELIRIGSDSPAETTLRLALLRAALPTPSLNIPIVEQGVELATPDLAWPAWRVCVEHEGPHHRSAEQQEKDIRRREQRERLGWIEVQTVAADLRASCGRGIRRVREALVRHGWRPDAEAPAR